MLGRVCNANNANAAGSLPSLRRRDTVSGRPATVSRLLPGLRRYRCLRLRAADRSGLTDDHLYRRPPLTPTVMRDRAASGQAVVSACLTGAIAACSAPV
jgi:hypothetical protein